MRKASIIISVDSEFPLVSNFFCALFSTHDRGAYEIVVVDDACADLKTVGYLHELQDKKQIDRLITLKDKVGFGRANNEGIAQSTEDYLVLLNTDIILCGGEIDRLLEKMKQLGCQAIQPVLLYPQNGKIQSCGHIFGHLFNRHAFENNTPDIFKELRPIERQAITPAFCILERDAFVNAGGFDPFYYNSFEALDLTLKIHLNGGRCFVVPDITAYHIRMASRSAVAFNEEQQNPYFWAKYAALVENDYEVCISGQLTPEIRSTKFFACDFTHLDLLESIKNAGVSVVESVNLQRPGKIECFGALPHSFLRMVYPLLFVCTNISQLYGNRLWTELRNRTNDLAIDASGNVVFVHEL